MLAAGPSLVHSVRYLIEMRVHQDQRTELPVQVRAPREEVREILVELRVAVEQRVLLAARIHKNRALGEFEQRRAALTDVDRVPQHASPR